MKHKVSHGLDIELAKKATDAALASYKERFAEYKTSYSWVTDTKATISFTVKGASLTGDLEVNGSSIDIDLKVPFLLKPFKGKALAVIEDKIKEWGAKAKAGEL